MPVSNDTKARIDLLVGIDKASYRNTRNSIDALFANRQAIQLDPRMLDGLTDGIRQAIATGGKDADREFEGLTKRFDKSMADLLQQFAVVRSDMVAADAAGNDAALEVLAERQRILNGEISAEVEAHKSRLEAAKKLKQATDPNLSNIKDAAETMGEGLVGAMDKAKAKDFAGLAQSMLGAMSKGASKGSEVLSAAKGSASSASSAAKFGAAASALTAAAAAIATVGASIAAVVAVLKAADDQARELNKTFLEGASMADFAFQSESTQIMDMTGSLDKARRATLNLATEFRGSAEEFAQILQALNQAGLSYKEMSAAAGTWRTEQQALEDAARQTFVWSQALGVSVGELAETESEWSKTFGMDLQRIDQNFAVIAGTAMESGFNVKRFFTAVSQATAGMAIYNIRMEEAAHLLAKTQKILGDTDAADFVRSLTQGFADESIVDRIKRIMIAGGQDTQKIFEGTAKRTSKAFVDEFAGSSTQKQLEAAFQHVKGFNVDVLQDPKKLQDTWGKLSGEDRRLVVAQLRQNGDEQSDAAARQLETLGRVVDGAEGGLDAQVRGMAALDMQGKLAYKLQTLGDRRLNDMSAVELAAFESYSGIGGAQLEQMMRVESQLMADYDLARKNGTTTATSFQDFIATNEEAAQKLDDVKKIEDEASWFARATVKNTRSAWEVLQNTIASILNDIYQLMGTWFASSKSLSKESIDKQSRAGAEIRGQRDAAEKRLEDLGEKLAKLDETIATTGADSEAHQEALREKTKVEAEQRQARASAEYLSAQSRQVLLLDEAQMQDLKSPTDVLQAAALAMSKSGEDLAIVGRHMTSEELASASAAKREIATSSHVGQKIQEARGMGSAGNVVLGGARAMEMAGVPSLLGLKGPMEELRDVQSLQATVVPDLLSANQSLSEEQVQALIRQGDLGDKSLKVDKDAMQQDKKFQAAFPDASRDATFEAMKLYEGWKLGISQGLTGEDLAQAARDWAAGDTALGRGKLAARLTESGYDVKKLAGPAMEPSPSAPNIANDFIMRPGQPAQLFNPGDTVFGMKPDGPLAKGGGGGNVTVNVYGGDQAAVYRTVKDALKNSGLRP